MLTYEAYKSFIRTYSARVWCRFSKNICTTNPAYICVEISNKNHKKIANKLEPGKD
jgi:hypothetical protein